MAIENWPISKFVPYVRNPRKNDQAVDRMAASIREFGFKIPVLARSDGEVVDGHLRLKAAQKLALAEIPVIICDEWSPVQVKAFRLLVNRSANWADWDFELLELEMQEFRDLEFDLELSGFDSSEIDRLLHPDAKVDEDDVESNLPETPMSRVGDLWVCGPHRVLCGDATSAEDVARLFGSLEPALMVTDPPYGVNYDPQWREDAGLGPQRQTGVVANDDRADWSPAYRLFPGDVAYVWHAGVHASEVAAGLASAGFEIRSQIVWSKQHFALGRGDYHWQHEPCWYAVRRGKPSSWCGDRTQSTVWEVPNLNPFGGNPEEDATGHSTQKPVELMRRPILNNTRRGAAVYDPFLGSGTTLIAAESCERVCLGLEIDSRYVDMIIRRWQKMTNGVARLEATGASFDDVSTERAGQLAEVR